MRTIHSANQFSVFGAVSSWCIDFSESMQGQESTEVKMSFQKKMNSDHKSWIRQMLVLWQKGQPGLPTLTPHQC